MTDKTWSKHQLKMILLFTETAEWLSSKEAAKKANVSESCAKTYCRKWTEAGYLKRVKFSDGYVYRHVAFPDEATEIARQFCQEA